LNLVLRSNYGDDSIALIAFIRESMAKEAMYAFKKVQVVYIDTGWSALSWQARVEAGEAYARQCGFEVVHLKSKASFSELVLMQKRFPTPKFQWCAGFLKGLPLLEWLDEHDPRGEWTVALPKRQALYRQSLLERQPECPYHGERAVWHPLHAMTDDVRDQLVTQAGFTVLHTRSLECEPCVNSTLAERGSMHEQDREKLKKLENKLSKKMFEDRSLLSMKQRDPFSRGCGDPFGCGL